MPFVLKGRKQQRELLQSLHRMHRVLERQYSFSRVGITFEGLGGAGHAWETLEGHGLIKVEHDPGKSPQTATVWLTDRGRALVKK
jgi:hypothetical protein